MVRHPPVDLLCRCLAREILREGFLNAPIDTALAS